MAEGILRRHHWSNTDLIKLYATPQTNNNGILESENKSALIMKKIVSRNKKKKNCSYYSILLMWMNSNLHTYVRTPAKIIW